MKPGRENAAGIHIGAGLSGYGACLGQSFISAELGLPASLHDSHASYIASWIDVLERDKTAIIHAAAKAEQAVAWLRRCSAVETLPHKIAA